MSDEPWKFFVNTIMWSNNGQFTDAYMYHLASMS